MPPCPTGTCRDAVSATVAAKITRRTLQLINKQPALYRIDIDADVKADTSYPGFSEIF